MGDDRLFVGDFIYKVLFRKVFEKLSNLLIEMTRIIANYLRSQSAHKGPFKCNLFPSGHYRKLKRYAFAYQ